MGESRDEEVGVACADRAQSIQRFRAPLVFRHEWRLLSGVGVVVRDFRLRGVELVVLGSIELVIQVESFVAS